ncbi:sulfotransferase domain-containing protein [Hyphobacterium sp.]|uniref:sulfotransferase domain-containing protein n=1 Tax=Hyphobacterium sp. TaxID=2004662 RepID=UPI003BA97CF2
MDIRHTEEWQERAATKLFEHVGRLNPGVDMSSIVQDARTMRGEHRRGSISFLGSRQERKPPWYAPVGEYVRKNLPALFPVLQLTRRVVWKILPLLPVLFGIAGGIFVSLAMLDGAINPEDRMLLAASSVTVGFFAALLLIIWRLRNYIARLSVQNHDLFAEIERMHDLAGEREGRIERLFADHVGLTRRVASLDGAHAKRREAEMQRQMQSLSARLDQTAVYDDVERREAEMQKQIQSLSARLDQTAVYDDVERQYEGLQQRLNAVLDEQARLMDRTAERAMDFDEKVRAELSAKIAAIHIEMKSLESRQSERIAANDQATGELQKELNAALEVQSRLADHAGETEQLIETRLEALREQAEDQLQLVKQELSDRIVGVENKAEFGAMALDNAKVEIEASMKALRQGLEQRMFAEIDEHARSLSAELIARLDAVETAQTRGDEAYKAGLSDLKKVLDEEFKPEVGKVRGVAEAAHQAIGEIKAQVHVEKLERGRLRERTEASERQIGALRYPEAPDVFVFFGHHKCASRFFRLEVFKRVADSTGARIRQYEIKDPPFHYSRMDELDLVNVDFKGLGKDGRDVVWFANATQRGLNKIKRNAKNWKGLRIIRDPRQVLISNYFHHKGDHPDVAEVGWVWDQLVKDKPILRELPEEDGILHELDNISKQVIEDQILAPFDDDRVMTIRLEDYTQDPEAHLLNISEFLNVPDVTGINHGNTKANPDSSDWRKHFTSEIRERFKERYGQALIDLGYAEDMDW